MSGADLSFLSFLVARLGDFDVGVPSRDVRHVVLRRDWRASEPIDLDALFSCPAPAHNARRVLVITTPTTTVSLATSQDLVVRSCRSEELTSLPSALWSHPDARLFDAVAWPEAAAPLLVLSPSRIRQCDVEKGTQS